MNLSAQVSDPLAVADLRVSDQERHQAAVARSLGWARESAARGNYADALGWIEVIEAIGDQISAEYQLKRQEWLRFLSAARVLDTPSRPG